MRTVYSQVPTRYNSFSYNVNEGLLQSTIGAIVFDGNNFCWLSFPSGLQRYNGKIFIQVPVQEGLPDDKLCGLLSTRDGRIFIAHRFGISYYDIRTNRFTLVWKFKTDQNVAARFIGEDDNIVYFYTPAGTIVGIDSKSFSVLSVHKSGFPGFGDQPLYSPAIGKTIINHKVALILDSRICAWDLQRGTFYFRSQRIPDLSLYLLHLKNENEVLFNTYSPTGTLKIINTSTGQVREQKIRQAEKIILGRCGIYQWNGKILMNINNRLYETDSTLQVMKTELVNFQNQPFSSSSFSQVVVDRTGNLCIQTISDGIKKVLAHNYPVRYYNSGEKNKDFVLCILPDKPNNRILTGSVDGGVTVFDTSQRFIKRIEFKNEREVPLSVNCILKTPSGSYIVFASGQTVLWEISANLEVVNVIPIQLQSNVEKQGAKYFAHVLWVQSSKAIVQTQENIYEILFNGKKISAKEFPITDGYIMGGILYGNNFVTHANNQLIFLDTAHYSIVKKIPFLNTGYVRCFTKGSDNKLYVGTNNGLFVTDATGRIFNHITRKNGLPDDCIYAMKFDDAGNLWCSCNKGIFKISNDKPVLLLRKEDGLQENEFNTNSFASTDDGELFFGGVNGVSSFYPADIKPMNEELNIFFTGIRANGNDAVSDKAPWEVSSIRLPYFQNSLALDFLAMGNHNPDQYVYQYKMDGVDREWINREDLQTVRYSLPSGNYTFKVYASRAFNPDAKPLKELSIRILPPFWKTWWFLSLTSIFIIFLVIYFVNQKIKRRYMENLQRLENEKQLRQERERISKDLHDSLGVYANAVLFNSELLEKENSDEKRKAIVGDLKFVSKDIIVSLRETVWALKKERYFAEECLVRISNFIQQLSRYYPGIHFKTEGIAPAGVEFSHVKALNLVRIVQEAVSNCIKHAHPSHIFVRFNNDYKQWKIIIEDDGSGFDYYTAKRKGMGNGLNNIEHRAIESGFGLTIDSETGRGTIITVTV
jgi:signal transduction histidine kinase/outer membrane protein assembly factor BamB